MTDEVLISQKLREPLHVDTSGLQGSLDYQLRRAQISAYHIFSRYFKAWNIRPIQYAILTLVRDNPGLNQTRISDSLGIKRANLVALLDQLETRQLLTRISSSSDRRSHQLHLTEYGQKMMSELFACHDRCQKEFAAKLSENDRLTLLRLLMLLHGPEDAINLDSE
jgi:DNA-binding MarR family transcriptional regulator